MKSYCMGAWGTVEFGLPCKGARPDDDGDDDDKHQTNKIMHPPMGIPMLMPTYSHSKNCPNVWSFWKA